MQTGQSQPLHDMFSAVPPRYDLINHVITLGLDVRWRHRAARECLASKPLKVLDLCCGTGDLALDMAGMAGDGVSITGIDYSRPMLEIAARKATQTGRNISFVHGDVSNIPFPDGHFDCAGISFAFRNLTYKNPLTERFLQEVSRVLNDGGRFIIVETSQPGSKLIRFFNHLYLRCFVKTAGYLISGNRGAYNYLAESAARFYTPGKVKSLLISAGFSTVSYRPFLFGAVGIHVAVK